MSVRAAVLVIDLQVDYISGGDLVEGQISPLLQAFPELPNNVESLLSSARASDIPVVHVREVDNAKDSQWLSWWNTLHPPQGDNHVGAGVRATAEPWAAERGDEQVFIKHTYDAFNSGEVSQRLIKHLREELGVTRLYFAGALTKACVMFSANSAFTAGFEVVILEDCCGDRSREHHDSVLSVYDGYHIQVKKSSDIFPLRQV